jgi:fucose permease
VQIECPECSKMISDKADMCPHCGYPVKKAEKEEKKKVANEQANKACMIFILMAILLFFVALIVQIANPPSPTKNEPNDVDAFVMSQSFVEQRLIAPTTAKFPYIGDAYEVTKLDSVTWLVDSYVDSQNGFGAFIRTRYVAKLMYMGNDRWKLLNIKVYK